VTLSTINQTIQFSAWLIALVELVLALYVLVLNARHSANRHASVLLLVTAVHAFAVGWMISATNSSQAFHPALLLATTAPAIQPVLSVAIIAVVKPEWLRGRHRWTWWLVYLFAILPTALLAADLGLSTRLWFTGIPINYTGGFISLNQFTAGQLAYYVQLMAFVFAPALAILFLLYFTLIDRRLLPNSRGLAWLLLVAEVAAYVLSKSLASFLHPAAAALLSNTIFAAVYGYTAFQQMIAERRAQRGSLQARLAALILVVTMPLLIAVTIFVTRHAGAMLEQDALKELDSTNEALSTNTNLWLDSNVRALQELVKLPDIVSMNPARQKPVLEAMAFAYPQLSLVSTTGLNGINIARNDNEGPIDYHDQTWFQKASTGAQLTFQTRVGGTGGQSTLVASTPIRDESGDIIGVAMIATGLDVIVDRVQASKIGDNGMAFIVDGQNRVLVHPNPIFTAESRDMSTNPPVAVARHAPGNPPQGVPVAFTDEAGVSWRASASRLENGWIVVVQRPESELMAGEFLFQRVALVALAVGALLLLFLSWLTIRHAIQPISDLTETASSIATGDLTRVATIQSDDEIGALARAFNSMTTQLRESITNLERRVFERTRELERRAVQLQVAAEVASQTAAIRDLEQLLDHTVRLISDRFNFYHAGIFLIDENYAVLRAASSEGGQRMLARHHKLAVGQVGIVGHVAEEGKPRIALDVGNDAVFFNNPDLPQTRSEMALPLQAHEHIIGVLDVQSTKAAAFTEEDIEILQVLAGQVALAIENAELHSASEESLRELDTLYQQQVRQAWHQQMEGKELIYSYRAGKVTEELATPPTEKTNGRDDHLLKLPLVLREQSLGWITLRRYSNAQPWSKEEIELVKNTVNQIAMALENARLLQENRRRAQNEALVSQVTSNTQGLLDVDTVMKTAVQEIGRSLGLARVQIRLGNGQANSAADSEAVEPLESR